LKQENAIRNSRLLSNFFTIETTKPSAHTTQDTDVLSEADNVPSTSHQLLSSEDVLSDTESEPVIDDAQLTPYEVTLEPRGFSSVPVTDDPASLVNLSDVDRIKLASKVPVQVYNHDFPLNDETPKRS